MDGTGSGSSLTSMSFLVEVMCGRYRLAHRKHIVTERFEAYVPFCCTRQQNKNPAPVSNDAGRFVIQVISPS